MPKLAILLICLGLLGALFGFGFVAHSNVAVVRALLIVVIALAVLAFARLLTYRPTV
jgi:hypothetical protein